MVEEQKRRILVKAKAAEAEAVQQSKQLPTTVSSPAYQHGLAAATTITGIQPTAAGAAGSIFF